MSAAVQDSLQEIDTLVQCVALALSGTSVDDLLKVCNELPQQVSRLQLLLQQSPRSPSMQLQQVLQTRKVAAALASVQQNLARRAVLTQQTLQTLFPAVQSDTYSVQLGSRTNQPYGSAGRGSGEFRVITA